MSTNGKKLKLPDGWIVVNSKSHPDRVYYFNVKTNKSSWNEPTLINTETMVPVKDGRKSKKRKKEENGNAQARPTTPEISKNNEAPRSKRQILRAKRALVADKKQPEPEKKTPPQNETPQMRLIRERMLQKKSTSISRGKSTSKSTESTTQSSESTTQSSESTTQSSESTSQSSECTSTTTESTVASTSNDKGVTKKEALTPQMRVILEKMKQKANKPQTKRKVPPSGNITVNSDTAKKSTIPVRNTNNNVTVDSTDSTKTVGRRRARTEPVNIPLKKKSIQKTKGRKNIAQERMDHLRRSLETDAQNLKVTKSPDKPSTTPVQQSDVSPPPSYENANTRLRQLRVKLLREQLFSENQKTITKDENRRGGSLPPNDFPTVDKLIHQSTRESFYEDMEWESIPDEEIMCEVNNVRTQLYMNNNSSAITSVPENNLNIPAGERDNNPLYIVVDTNVFLSNLQAVEEARDAVFRTHSRPIIVIPWTVIRELDYLKEDRANIKSETLSAKARRAIRFLHQHFSSKHPRVLGQKPEDVERNKERFAIDCPDDEILQTCLQIQESGKSVVLLSYDKNLSNKAMIHDISTLGRNEPFEKIDYLNASSIRNDSISSCKIDADQSNIVMPPISQELRITDEIFEDAKLVMKSFLTVVVAQEMENLFGENWEKYTIIRPPWTMEEVLKCALKHWMAAVSESFLRRAEYILKDLLPAFTILPGGGRRIHDVAYLLDRCSDLIQTTKIDKHPDLMIKASNSIDELKQKLSDYEASLKRKSLQDEAKRNVEEAEVKAKRAFDYFEEIYKYSRDICGLAAEKVRMPCSFFYVVPDPMPNDEILKQIQPDLAANINRLIHVLRNALEQVDNSCMDNRCLNSLFWAITNFLPDDKTRLLVKKHGEFLEPADVYHCLKEKQQLLQTGLRQLQELCTHFCRLATYKIGS